MFYSNKKRFVGIVVENRDCKSGLCCSDLSRKIRHHLDNDEFISGSGGS
ncbi:MAG: hypothetical protein R6U52_02025 [Kosmotogaceae bacterium]